MSLFEAETYENLMERAMARISSAFDKREGSMVFNGVAPAMAELAQLYIGLDFVFTATYISTAPREYLIERAKDRGLSPKGASPATFMAAFNTEVPIGSRFSCEDLNFYVSERFSDMDTPGSYAYKAVCETPGSAANAYSGALIPIEYISGLSHAELVELLIPGDDEEGTEVFRQRVLSSLRSQAFGGNQADYRQKVLEIDGVEAVKVRPVWNSDAPPSSFIPSEAVKSWYDGGMEGVSDSSVREWVTAVYSAASDRKLAVGGCVRLIIMASGGLAPSETLLDKVQTVIDPTQNAGEGMGLAPIGHVVKVDGVKPVPINLTTDITLAAGWSWEDAKPYIASAFDEYLGELAGVWGSSDRVVVRISQIESRILQECSAIVVDIQDTLLNGEKTNLALDEDCIPIRGSINE